MNTIEKKIIKVFMPSSGLVKNKQALVLKRNRILELCVLKEDVTLYGETPTQAHTALVNDTNNIYHFSGGLVSALNKFDTLEHATIIKHQEQLASLIKGKVTHEHNR